MNSSYLFALRCVLVLALIPASLAFAVKKETQDKAERAFESYWNPNPAGISFAEVPEQEPLNNDCPGEPLNCSDVLRPAAISPAGDNDYISFTVPDGQNIGLGTDADGATPAGDTVIYLYRGVACAAEDLVASDDDSGPGLYSLLNYCVPAGAGGTYTGRITHFSVAATGTYKAFVTCTNSSGGETCAMAPELPCGNINLSGNTACNQNDYTPITTGTSCTGFTAAGRDVVYTFSASAGAHLNVSYTSTADGSLYLIGLPAGSSACINPGGETCVRGADATLFGQAEVLDYTTTTSGSFYLILDSFGTNTSGSWTLNGFLDCPVVGVHGATWSHVKLLYRDATR